MSLINSGNAVSGGTNWSKYLPVGFDGSIIPAAAGTWKTVCNIQGAGFLHAAAIYGAPLGSYSIFFRITVDGTVLLSSAHGESISNTSPQVSALVQEEALSGGSDGSGMTIRIGLLARSINKNGNATLALPGSPAATAGSNAVLSILKGMGYPFKSSVLVEIKTTNLSTNPVSTLVQASVEQ